MPINERLRSLSQLPAPLLTVYVSTASVEASRHAPFLPSVTWLRNEGKNLVGRVPANELSVFQKQLHRVEEFLRGRKSQERGLAIFAGPATWETVPVQADIVNELHWGKPAVAQLQWLAAEHKPCGLVVIDHGGARFFSYWLGDIAKLQETVFEVDVTRWKRKDMGHVARPGVRMSHGSQRDVFEHRMDAQYERACRETAEEANRLREKENFAAIFLAGPERLIEPIEQEFPQEIRPQVISIQKDLGKLAAFELRDYIEPAIEKWEGEHESALVSGLLDAERGAVLGIDETLPQLQAGKLRSLLLARDFDAGLQQCRICSWTDRSADPLCPVCKGERRPTKLQETLPDLALRFGANIEVVSGEAGEKLRRAGGIGGWLGKQKQHELQRAAVRAR